VSFYFILIIFLLVINKLDQMMILDLTFAMFKYHQTKLILFAKALEQTVPPLYKTENALLLIPKI